MNENSIFQSNTARARYCPGATKRKIAVPKTAKAARPYGQRCPSFLLPSGAGCFSASIYTYGTGGGKVTSKRWPLVAGIYWATIADALFPPQLSS